MATLISNADGNLTGAATFAAAEAGALALVTNRNTLATLANNTTVTSVTFTVTTGKVIDAVLLWFKQSAASTTGTLTVTLLKGGVSQASVVVNKTDLPDSTNAFALPVLFKFTGTATGDGAANWTISVIATGSPPLNMYTASVGNTNFTRALRTTTAATPAAADDLYIVGELTGAGTKNVRVVTMDSTAATAYGNGALNSGTVAGGVISISNYATLAYANAASTNYILRVNGDLFVQGYGTLNIGSSGAEIPRNSTAVLEFQQVSADGDFGLRILDNATCNIAGLSRTSGKNVVACKLTADVAAASIITGAPAATAGTITTFPVEATGNSLLAVAFTDTAASSTHHVLWTGPSVAGNTTQTFSVWLGRGSGTNNRFVRVLISESASAAPVNGCYTDVDLQAGTAGTATSIGNGTGISASITPAGIGFVVKLTGRATSATLTTRFVIAACSAAGTVSYVGNTTPCFVYDHYAALTATSISDTTFSVDTDTGWLNGDAICVASTSRTGTDAGIYPLNADAGSSSMVTSLYLGSGSSTLVHLGTAPRQAEVINLTRNIKVRSTSATLMSYVYCAALATVNFSWAEFRYLGINTVGKRGIEIDGGAIANAKSITYCSLHDFENWGLWCASTSTASLNLTFSNNVIWLSAAGAFGTLTGVITNTDWTFDSNIIMRCAGGWNLGDIGGVLTNNIVSSCTAATASFALGETGAVIGTFSGNSAHSCANFGLSFVADTSGLVSNFAAWRNAQSGISPPSCYDLIFDGLTLFGNATSNITSSTFGYDIAIKNAAINSDSAFTTGIGFNGTANTTYRLRLENVDMSATAVGGGGAAHTTADFSLTANTGTRVEVIASNVKPGTTPFYSSKTPWSSNSFIHYEKFNQTAGDHRTELKYGTLRTDSTIYNSTSPSMRMTPNDASNKLQSAPLYKGILAAVANSGTVTASVSVRKSASGDGAAYNGNQPRLIVRSNPAIGVTTDTVLDTMTVTTGSWEMLTGTTAAATDDGAFEFIVDCDGTTGFVNCDDWSFT